MVLLYSAFAALGAAATLKSALAASISRRAPSFANGNAIKRLFASNWY